MSETSHVLGLPFIQPAQAQKHVTHNEALRTLDAIVQLAVLDQDQTSPPATPNLGDRHIVASGATSSWSGKDGQIAFFDDGGWIFFSPQVGWQTYVVADGGTFVWDGSAWSAVVGGPSVPESVDTLGVNATANVTNRLTVSSEATLLTHAGTDHRLVVNKSSLSDTASLLFQSNWTGHAEMGLSGAADFSIRVSPDGSSFVDAVRIDAATGVVVVPEGVSFGDDALSVYLQGTWIPRLTIGGTDSGISYAAQNGWFTQIGNSVNLTAELTLSDAGTGTGQIEISDLPVTPGASGAVGQIAIETGALGLNHPICRLNASGNIGLFDQGTTGATALTDANLSNEMSLTISLRYSV